MELRTTEETIQDLRIVYESIRQSPVLQSESVDEVIFPSCPSLFILQNDNQDNNESENTGVDNNNNNSIPAVTNLRDLVQALEKLQMTLDTLVPKISRFRKRLFEKDPVTGNPRYGTRAQNRVQSMLTAYDFLRSHIPLPPNSGSSNDDNNNNDDTANNDNEINKYSVVLQTLQQQYMQQVECERLAQQAAQVEAKRQEEEKVRLEQSQQQAQAQQAMEQAQRLQEQQAQEEAELRRQAQMARERRLAQEQAERDWVNSISKGPEGVRKQLNVLKDNTQHDKNAQSTAIRSLHTIFKQINAHPEETNFRRIRRDHPQFTQDIGRHKGGVELLIAAGFELSTIDEIPVYLSKEPNLETDMDGWAAWFDTLKATLNILEEECAKLK